MVTVHTKFISWSIIRPPFVGKKIHYCVYKTPLLDPILSHLNAVPTLAHNFFKSILILSCIKAFAYVCQIFSSLQVSRQKIYMHLTFSLRATSHPSFGHLHDFWWRARNGKLITVRNFPPILLFFRLSWVQLFLYHLEVSHLNTKG
jgi:hypothetical protein